MVSQPQAGRGQIIHGVVELGHLAGGVIAGIDQQFVVFLDQLLGRRARMATPRLREYEFVRQGQQAIHVPRFGRFRVIA